MFAWEEGGGCLGFGAHSFGVERLLDHDVLFDVGARLFGSVVLVVVDQLRREKVLY